MKKIILGMVLIFMSTFVTPCRGAVSSSNSEVLRNSQHQESKEANNFEDEALGGIVVLVALYFIFMYNYKFWRDWPQDK